MQILQNPFDNISKVHPTCQWNVQWCTEITNRTFAKCKERMYENSIKLIWIGKQITKYQTENRILLEIKKKEPRWTLQEVITWTIGNNKWLFFFLFNVLCSNIIKWKFNCLSTIYSIMHIHIAISSYELSHVTWVLFFPFFFMDYIFIFIFNLFSSWKLTFWVLQKLYNCHHLVAIFLVLFIYIFFYIFNIQTLIPLMIAHNIYYLLFNFHILCILYLDMYYLFIYIHFQHDSKMGNIRS